MDVLAIAVLCGMLALGALVLKRAGYSPWWTLLLLLPGLNMIGLVVFALSTWPIERELACARVELGRARNDDYWLALDVARKAEVAGDCSRAVTIYKRIIEVGGEHPAVVEAEQRLAEASDALPNTAAVADVPGGQPQA